jgi:hypothetical protein
MGHGQTGERLTVGEHCINGTRFFSMLRFIGNQTALRLSDKHRFHDVFTGRVDGVYHSRLRPSRRRLISETYDYGRWY